MRWPALLDPGLRSYRDDLLQVSELGMAPQNRVTPFIIPKKVLDNPLVLERDECRLRFVS